MKDYTALKKMRRDLAVQRRKIVEQIPARASLSWVSPATGFQCFVVENKFEEWESLPESSHLLLREKWYCGYVRVPRVPRLIDYVPVHGGVTMHEAEPARTFLSDTFLVGFDANHYRDHLDHWTIERVQAETERLAIGLRMALRFDHALRPVRKGGSRKWNRRRRKKRLRARVRIITRLHRSLASAGQRPFQLSDQVGALLNLLSGKL